MLNPSVLIIPASLLVIAFIASLFLKGKLGVYTYSILSAIASLFMIYIGLDVLIRGSSISYTVFSYIAGTLSLGLNRLELVVDPVSAVFLVALGILGLAVSMYSLNYLEHYMNKYSLEFFGTTYTLFLASMYMVLTVYNLVWFIIFWELMTVFSQFLVAYEYRRDIARKAAYKYFFMAKASSEFIILFILLTLIYLSGFNPNYLNVKMAIALTAQQNPLLIAGIFVILLAGLSVKSAIYPLHSWLPDAHSEAPSNISALLSGIMVKMAIYMMIRSFVWFAPSLITLI